MMRVRSILWSLATVCLAGVVSYFVARETMQHSKDASTEGHSEQGFHDWLHENLEITPQQEKLLLSHELTYEKDRSRIRQEIEATGRELADAIRSFDAGSAEVTAAREQLAKLQGELQKVTLDHFFAMKEHLNEEQGAKLLRWTHDSIINGHYD